MGNSITVDSKAEKSIVVNLNGNDVSIEMKKYTLAELKSALSVPPEYVLDEILGNQIKEMPADKPIQVHPEQKFVSHVPEGSAS